VEAIAVLDSDLGSIRHAFRKVDAVPGLVDNFAELGHAVDKIADLLERVSMAWGERLTRREADGDAQIEAACPIAKAHVAELDPDAISRIAPWNFLGADCDGTVGRTAVDRSRNGHGCSLRKAAR